MQDNQVTTILQQAHAVYVRAADELLPPVYDELRLAAGGQAHVNVALGSRCRGGGTWHQADRDRYCKDT